MDMVQYEILLAPMPPCLRELPLQRPEDCYEASLTPLVTSPIFNSGRMRERGKVTVTTQNASGPQKARGPKIVVQSETVVWLCRC